MKNIWKNQSSNQYLVMMTTYSALIENDV